MLKKSEINFFAFSHRIFLDVPSEELVNLYYEYISNADMNKNFIISNIKLEKPVYKQTIIT